MSSTPHLCRDCRWCHVPPLDRIMFPTQPYRFAQCRHPIAMYRDDPQTLVDGTPSAPLYCSTVRDMRDLCGRDGKLWEGTS